MVKGLYTAYTGMANEQKRLDIIANNLANAATVGYKEEGVTNQAFNDVFVSKIRDRSEANNDRVIGRMNPGVKLGEVYTDFGQGPLRETGNPYNLALEGKGFFAVSVTDRAGNVSTKYTRNGSFTLAMDGRLVDADGNGLLGSGGELQIPVDAVDVVIDPQGDVYADGAFVDSLQLADFEDYNYLMKSGDTMYTIQEGAVELPAEATVLQGFTEQSNVNVVSGMVDMISITRAYEANQKVIQSVDRTLDLAANSVGKV